MEMEHRLRCSQLTVCAHERACSPLPYLHTRGQLVGDGSSHHVAWNFGRSGLVASFHIHSLLKPFWRACEILSNVGSGLWLLAQGLGKLTLTESRRH